MTINLILTCRYPGGQYQYTTFVTPTLTVTLYTQAPSRAPLSSILPSLENIWRDFGKIVHCIFFFTKIIICISSQWSPCHINLNPGFLFDSFSLRLSRIYEFILIWPMMWRWKFLTFLINLAFILCGKHLSFSKENVLLSDQVE